MSSTNTTPNFGLPQYIATDKPTYLGDFNKAMLDIDTNMKTIENKAVSAESSVATANSNASQALENANQASTKADTAQAAAAQAQTTATQAQATAEQAQTSATNAQNIADTVNNSITNLINGINNWDNQDIRPETTGIWASSVSKFSCNKTLKLLQLYGYVSSASKLQAPFKIGQLPSYLRPKEQLRIFNGASVLGESSNSYVPEEIDIKQDGSIMVPNWNIKFTQSRWNVTINISDINRWQIN